MATFRETGRFVHDDDDRHSDIPLRFDDRREMKLPSGEGKALTIVVCWAVPMMGLLAILVETVGRVSPA